MYSVFLSSHTNTHESLGELEKAVETLACGSCSHSISRSPKLPLAASVSTAFSSSPKLPLVFVYSYFNLRCRIKASNLRDKTEW